MLRNCESCKKEFNANKRDVERGFGRFCCRKCGQASRCKPGKANAWRYYRESDGRWYRKWREEGSRKVHQQLENRWVWEQLYGPIPEGYDIHHKNENPKNNDPGNLQLIPSEEHNAYHQRKREDHRIGEDGIEERKCQRCLAYKKLSDFNTRTDGTYQGYCKLCARESLQAWRKKNRLKANQYQKEWRLRQKGQSVK